MRHRYEKPGTETPQHDRNVNLSIYVNGLNGRSGGSGTYALSGKTLAAVFSLTAKSGDYPLDAPLTIGTIQGKTIWMLAGDPAMNQQRLISDQNKLLKDQPVRSGK